MAAPAGSGLLLAPNVDLNMNADVLEWNFFSVSRACAGICQMKDLLLDVEDRSGY